MDLTLRGRRCQLGSMHGPMNHECLNGTHPAMLAAQRCNSDVQFPYRFPIIRESHCCDHAACLESSDKTMIECTQPAQDAQAGYACDYCTKPVSQWLSTKSKTVAKHIKHWENTFDRNHSTRSASAMLHGSCMMRTAKPSCALKFKTPIYVRCIKP